MSRRTLTRHFIKATGMRLPTGLLAECLRRSQILLEVRQPANRKRRRAGGGFISGDVSAAALACAGASLAEWQDVCTPAAVSVAPPGNYPVSILVSSATTADTAK